MSLNVDTLALRIGGGRGGEAHFATLEDAQAALAFTQDLMGRDPNLVTLVKISTGTNGGSNSLAPL